MPTYDYACEKCGHAEEIFHGMKEEPKKRCPKCRSTRFKRLIGSGGGIIFKGGGFYETDYRSEAYKSDAKKDVAPTAADPKKDATPAAPAAPAEPKKSDAPSPSKKKDS